MVWCDIPTSLADFGLTFAICQPPLGCVDPILCQLGLSHMHALGHCALAAFIGPGLEGSLEFSQTT